METVHGKTQYTLIIKGKVQSIGFRGYIEEACERLGIGGIGYNIGTGEVRILCKAERETLEELSNLLRRYEFADISELDIEEGAILPDVYYRSVYDTEKEIFTRLDEGVRVLHDIKDDTKKIGEIKEDTKKIGDAVYSIKEDTSKIGEIVDTNKEIVKVLKEMSEKL